ncbi:MAG TPA: hypothetical protein VD790_03530 [Thermoleophilaceae bacterium]|nr:hypothetical protein [Thermoleophilaceae bacterium]
MLPRLFGPFFVFAGVMHFVIPRTYEAIVPDSLPSKRELVYASGVAEIAGGLGVMHPRTRRAAAWWSVATLVAVFPANLNMALNPDRYKVPGGRAALYARLPVQILFIAWAIAAGRRIQE